LIVVEDAPDKTPAFGFFCAERLAGERQAERTRLSGQPRKNPRAAGIGNEPDIRERLDEFCTLRRKHDVGGKGDIGAGSRRHAIHRADHRLRQPDEPPDERIVTIFERLPQIDAICARCDRAIRKILPGAKATPGTRDQKSANFGIPLDTRQRFRNLTVHFDIEAVQTARPVERQPRGALRDIEQNRVIRHRRTSCERADWPASIGEQA
jgi:hypothetical protein